MTQEDQDAIIGRTLRERNEKRQELARLTAEAQRLGMIFDELGKWLKQLPQAVAFENEPIELQFQRRDIHLFKAGELDPKNIIALTTEIRRVTLDVNNLNDRAKQLGIDQ